MQTFTVVLNGANEVPPVSTNAVGMAMVVLNGATLCWNISWSGTTTDVIMAHFHGPATPDMNASVQVDIGANSNQIAPFISPLIGETMLLLGSDQIDQLLSGLWYINIHTEMYPDGEIRGQVLDNGPIPPKPIPKPICPPFKKGHMMRRGRRIMNGQMNIMRRNRMNMIRSNGALYPNANNGNNVNNDNQVQVNNQIMRMNRAMAQMSRMMQMKMDNRNKGKRLGRCKHCGDEHPDYDNDDYSDYDD